MKASSVLLTRNCCSRFSSTGGSPDNISNNTCRCQRHGGKSRGCSQQKIIISLAFAKTLHRHSCVPPGAAERQSTSCMCGGSDSFTQQTDPSIILLMFNRFLLELFMHSSCNDSELCLCLCTECVSKWTSNCFVEHSGVGLPMSCLSPCLSCQAPGSRPSQTSLPLPNEGPQSHYRNLYTIS